MKSKEQLHSELELANSVLKDSNKKFLQIKNLLSETEDVIVAIKIVIEKLQDQIKIIDYNNLTVVEEDYREKDIQSFRDRMPEVASKLDKEGTIIIVDPIVDWIKKNPELLEKHHDCHMAISRYEGIVFACQSYDEFSIKLKNLPAGMISALLIFHASKYFCKKTGKIIVPT